VRELERTGEDHVFVDITAKSKEYLQKRFPTIYNECLGRGIDISRDYIPVCPVQHYLMGGIETDLHGRTNIEGLYACGEAAYTGVHGANRLASNSMLECLVFGRRAALDISAADRTGKSRTAVLPKLDVRSAPTRSLTEIRREIQNLMSEYGYVIRTIKGLRYALGEITKLKATLEGEYEPSNEYLETRNIATVAVAILEAALNRPVSIGSHYVEAE
jgi:L-aspartate oxidase